jgi:PAS domain S-box-containing protein
VNKPPPNRVLIVENVAADAELVIAELRRAELDAEVEVTANKAAFEAALARKTFDVVLADYRLPGWTGMDALARLRELGHATPLIVVTGTLGEERAAECILLGAADFVLKSNLARLPVAVRRVLAESRASKVTNQWAVPQVVAPVPVSRHVKLVAIALGVMGISLLSVGRSDLPILHNALDAGNALLLGVLALLFRDMAGRFDHSFPRRLWYTFAVTFVFALVHVLVSLEWLGVLAFLSPVDTRTNVVRPLTWPPAAYVLPVGMLAAFILHRRGRKATPFFLGGLALLGAAILFTTWIVPRYTAPILGITRPLLIAVPVLWGFTATEALRTRKEFRLSGVLALASVIMVVSQAAMLYSRSPHDGMGMAAHLGELTGLLCVLIFTTQLAASDMAALSSARRELAEANASLEQRVAERTELIAASEARFRALIEDSADGIVLIDRSGTVRYRSQSAKRLVGLGDDEGEGGSFLGRITPEDAALASATMESVMREHRGRRQVQLRVRVRGDVRVFECVASNLLDDPKVNAVVVNFRDITLRLRAEQAAREGDERFREMADHIKEAFFVVDLHTQATLYISPTWAEIWGRPIEEGYDPAIWFNSIHVEDRALVAATQEAVRAGRADESVFRVIRPDKSIRFVRGRAFPVRNASGVVYRMVGVSDDITELRMAEARAAQAQKMEAVGRLAGGVAHDFNNLLTVICAEAEFAQASLTPGSDVHQAFSEILNASNSAAGLTRQLLAFSRKQIVEPIVFELNDAVSDTCKMLRRLIGEDVRLDLRLAAGAGFVRADRGQIEQVLTNLAVNARDALPNGGSIIIETSRQTIEEDSHGASLEVPPGEYSVLIVSDTGVGMTSEVKAHAFEPFYTTKEQGKGTGLGLATCQGIVRQAGGQITLYSERDIGTTFRVYLPTVEAAGVRTASAPQASSRGSETVLMVEDEIAVRRVGLRMLRGLGYTVLEARDGADALRILASHPGNIDLLFTDVVLPGIGGRELADRIRTQRPGIRVLFTSGYTDDVVLQQRLVALDFALLSKPYTQVTLAKKVREALDSPPVVR